MLHFSEFRSWMDKWDTYQETSGKKQQIKAFFDQNDLIMFFTYEGDVYGSPEESRLVFARMVAKELPSDTTFVAYDLEKTLEGDEVLKTFSKKDFKKMHIIPVEEAEKLLAKKHIDSTPILDNPEEKELNERP